MYVARKEEFPGQTRCSNFCWGLEAFGTVKNCSAGALVLVCNTKELCIFYTVCNSHFKLLLFFFTVEASGMLALQALPVGQQTA